VRRGEAARRRLASVRLRVSRLRLAYAPASGLLLRYDRRKMPFLGVGTGFGSAMVVDGIVEPGSWVTFRSERPLSRTTSENVAATAALEPEYVVLGGGKAKRLEHLPVNVRLGRNDNAFKSAFRLWNV
jgi:polyphosphate glucokinase